MILEVGQALANTGLLALFAVPLAFTLGYAMGAVAGCFPGGWLDRCVTGTAVAGVSVPNYWLGIVLVILFSVQYMWLPATGMGPDGVSQLHLLQWTDLKYFVLPVITLAMIPIGIIARSTRAAVAEIRNQDFVQTLRAKGLSEWAVIRHVLKNALPPAMAVMGLQFGYLLGGSILVETVFTWPGSGFLLSKAIINRDVPVLQGTILALSLIFVATNLRRRPAAVAGRSAHAPRMSRDPRRRRCRCRPNSRTPVGRPIGRSRTPATVVRGYWQSVGLPPAPRPRDAGLCRHRSRDRAGGDLRAADRAVRSATRRASSAG